MSVVINKIIPQAILLYKRKFNNGSKLIPLCYIHFNPNFGRCFTENLFSVTWHLHIGFGYTSIKFQMAIFKRVYPCRVVNIRNLDFVAYYLLKQIIIGKNIYLCIILYMNVTVSFKVNICFIDVILH